MSGFINSVPPTDIPGLVDSLPTDPATLGFAFAILTVLAIAASKTINWEEYPEFEAMATWLAPVTMAIAVATEIAGWFPVEATVTFALVLGHFSNWWTNNAIFINPPSPD